LARRSMRSERIQFPNLDGYRLGGILDLPANGKPNGFAVFSHCFTCNKQYKLAVFLGRLLAEKGYGLLRYDFPGLGESEGDFSQTTFQGYVSDVRHASEFLRKNYSAPVMLIGHSFGGGASLAAAESIGSIKLVVTFAATARPADVRPGLQDAKEEAESTGLGRLTIDGKTLELRREFFDSLTDVELEPSVRALRAKLLAVHSTDDEIVPFENAQSLVKWAPRSELLRLEGAGHLFTNNEHVKQVIESIGRKLDL
jgi:pimeloyl-ACP methyl ester carboxylesterase